MKTCQTVHSILPLVLACALPGGSILQGAEPDARQAAIHQTAEAFVAAFHKGDAKALAAFWTPDGDYIDETGRTIKGREAIEQTYAELFAANKGMTLRIEVADLKFPTPDTAIEDGTSVVMAPDGSAPSRARYTNVFVKSDGKWLLASVRESADPGPSNYEFLRGLEWAIGEWIDETPAAGTPAGEVGHVSFTWAPGQNFIISTRTADFKDHCLLQSTQWVGWDAAAKQIRSWSFLADGGFSQSTWTRDGDKWIIKSESVIADGAKVVSTNIVTPVDAGTFTWQAKEQSVNGQALPDSKPVTMKRVK
ncbi:MAG: SgcJ/EcaC family oxidoreductase [Verrucomicrobia bacterium]|nr:SgcJ/EcaC family oxidoreductase [Verrucomicrobiota bacterium]